MMMMMTKRLTIFPVLAMVVFLCGCPPEKDARDAIAAAHGWITNAQTTWGPTCVANPTQIQCTSTNKLIAAQHAAADALTVYCGGVPAAGQVAYIDGGACVENKSAQGVLLSAVTQMNNIIADVKALLAKGGN